MQFLYFAVSQAVKNVLYTGDGSFDKPLEELILSDDSGSDDDTTVASSKVCFQHVCERIVQKIELHATATELWRLNGTVFRATTSSKIH